MIGSAVVDTATAVAIVVGSIGTAAAAVIGAIYAAKAASNTKTPPGSPPLGELGVNTSAAVTTPPLHPPLGQLVADGVEAVAEVKEAVNGKNGG